MARPSDKYIALWIEQHEREATRRPLSAGEESFLELAKEVRDLRAAAAALSEEEREDMRQAFFFYLAHHHRKNTLLAILDRLTKE